MFEDKSFEVHSPPFIEVVKISRFKDIFSFKPCLGLEKPIKSTKICFKKSRRALSYIGIILIQQL